MLLDELDKLAKAQPEYDRVSVGFPGAIRRGRVREVPAFSRRGPGLKPDPELVAAWNGFELEDALQERFGRPTRVANDADVQGCAVVTGNGMELVITLGTGVGSAVFFDGTLLPHMELSHGRFAEGLSIEVACGDHHREKIGNKAWRKLVMSALDAFEAMVLPDHIHIGGGNAKTPRPGHPRPEPLRRPEHLRAARRHQALGARHGCDCARRGPHTREVLARRPRPVLVPCGRITPWPTPSRSQPSPGPTSGPRSPSTTPPWPRATCATCSPTTPAASRR